MSGALILTGAPGSGKSSVLDALSTLLEIERVRFGAVESEQLARGYPGLLATEWVPQLAVVASLQKKVGRDTLLVVATAEDEDQLLAVVNAVNAQPVLFVCLAAPPRRGRGACRREGTRLLARESRICRSRSCARRTDPGSPRGRLSHLNRQPRRG